MALRSRHEGDHEYAGAVVFAGTVSIPDGSIDEDALAAATVIPAEKLEHQFPVMLSIDGATTLTTKSYLAHIAQGAGELVSFKVASPAVPTGSGCDKTATVEFEKSTGGAAFVSLLTTAPVIDSAESNNVPEAGVVSGSNTYAAADVLRITVTVAGSTGTQAAGLVAVAILREQAD